MNRPWWAGFARVEVPIACAAQQHRIVWADGGLRAPDHPDAERERALAALGADPYPCLQLLDLWTRHTDDLDVLLLASRGPGDALERDDENENDPLPAGMFGAYRSSGSAPMVSARPVRAVGWTSYSPLHRGRRMPPWYPHDHDERAEAERLLLLGRNLPDRLVATVVATWAERIERADERVGPALPALRAALYGRLRTTVGTWLGAAPALELELIPASAQPGVAGSRTELRFALPFSWLRDVWCKGFALTLGMLCLAVEQPGEEQWRLTAIAPPSPDIATPRTIAARVEAADELRW